jgi:hypothetical protein
MSRAKRSRIYIIHVCMSSIHMCVLVLKLWAEFNLHTTCMYVVHVYIHVYTVCAVRTTVHLLIVNASQYLHTPTISPIAWLTLNVE